MNLSEMSGQYGKNDNSGRDSMYCEDAAEVCRKLLELQESLVSPGAMAAIENGLVKNSKVSTVRSREMAQIIAGRLETLRAPMGSRIMIEYVRQKISEFHKSESK